MGSFTAKRDYWKKQVAEWEKSGESGKKWATGRGYNYQTFLYWKSRFHSPVKREDFVELSDKRVGSLQILFQGVQIEISEQFHSETLSRLLTVIKRALC